ncbi:hypothetical protein GCM10027610_009850 [Dactylosporangium cerinum]
MPRLVAAVEDALADPAIGELVLRGPGRPGAAVLRLHVRVPLLTGTGTHTIIYDRMEGRVILTFPQLVRHRRCG